jgi:hypothetical protein
MRGEMGSTGRVQYAHLRRRVPFALGGSKRVCNQETLSQPEGSP